MKHVDIIEVMTKEEYVGREVTVCGWVRTARDSKTMAFIELNDGTSLKHIQLVVDKETFGKADEMSNFTKLGSSLKVVGTVVPSAVAQDGGVEINVSDIELLGPCPEDYPLQKKRTNLETLRTMPHLRVRTNTFNAVFRVRSVLAAAIHEYFQDRHYVYVNTPLITGSDCEGAGEMFKVDSPGKKDFFGAEAALTVSGQLQAENFAMAFGDVYTFGPTFRAEDSNTPRHAAEFWMIEPEIAFADLEDDMQLAEDMLKFVISDVMDKCPDELAMLNNFVEKGLIDKLENVSDSKFVRCSYTDAVDILEKSGEKFEYPIK